VRFCHRRDDETINFNAIAIKYCVRIEKGIPSEREEINYIDGKLIK